MMDIEKFDQEHLSSLRSLSPYGIANVLRAKGITGKTCNPEFCPIAVWVRDVTGAEYSVASSRFMVYGPANPTPGVDRPMIKTPESIYDFMQAFDQGCYPDLED